MLLKLKAKTLNTTHWYALYTKPRNEKKVAEKLADLGIEVYCPLVTTVKVWSDRKKKIKEPLFKSYVFVKINDHQRDVVFQSHGVVRYVFWLGKPAVIRDAEILAIQDFLQHTEIKEGHRIEFEYLQELDVLSGPFKGQKGKYLQKNKNRLILLIESLGMVIKAEMHHSQVA